MRKAPIFVFGVVFSLALFTLLAVSYPTSKTYKITVDYSQTYEKMVGAGHYDWIRPLDMYYGSQIPSWKRGKKEVTIELVQFDKPMKTDDVLRELDKLGFRPATLPELLALGAQHPDAQIKGPVVALSIVWPGRISYDGAVACLSYNYEGRNLYFPSWSIADDRWHESYRFAAVRK